MSIRFGLLALLERGPSHGAQLRLDFEARTGATWPLNIGQVYMTLARLERDGLVESRTGAGARQHYAITDAGRREVGEWYARPVDRSQPARDELAIKVAMAVGTQGSGIGDVIAIQRRHTLRAMQGYARLKLRTALDGPSDRRVLAWLLVLEQLVFQAEAEVRWLAHCERQLTDGGTTATDRDDHGHRPGGRPAGGPPEAEPGRPGAARAGGGAGTPDPHRRPHPTHRPRTHRPRTHRLRSGGRPTRHRSIGATHRRRTTQDGRTARPRRPTAADHRTTAPTPRPPTAAQPRRTTREGARA